MSLAFAFTFTIVSERASKPRRIEQMNNIVAMCVIVAFYFDPFSVFAIYCFCVDRGILLSLSVCISVRVTESQVIYYTFFFPDRNKEEGLVLTCFTFTYLVLSRVFSRRSKTQVSLSLWYSRDSEPLLRLLDGFDFVFQSVISFHFTCGRLNKMDGVDM